MSLAGSKWNDKLLFMEDAWPAVSGLLLTLQSMVVLNIPWNIKFSESQGQLRFIEMLSIQQVHLCALIYYLILTELLCFVSDDNKHRTHRTAIISAAFNPKVLWLQYLFLNQSFLGYFLYFIIGFVVSSSGILWRHSNSKFGHISNLEWAWPFVFFVDWQLTRFWLNN